MARGPSGFTGTTRAGSTVRAPARPPTESSRVARGEMPRATQERRPDDTRRQIEAAWIEAVAEESDADPMFSRIAESFHGFREGALPGPG